MKNFRILTITLMLCTCQLATTGAVASEKASKERVENKSHLPVYQNAIAEISLDYNGAMLTGSIKLDNGVLLHIVDYKSRDDNQLKKWRRGDLLSFNAEVDNEKGFLLSARRVGKDKENVEPYFVFDVMEGPKSCLTIAEINEDGKIVKLSDNSVWEFSWFNQFATRNWKVGQHVLVEKVKKRNSYKFVNLNTPVSLKSASANGMFTIQL